MPSVTRADVVSVDNSQHRPGHPFLQVATVDGFVHDLLAQLAREGDEVVQDFLKKRSFEFPLKVQHAAQYAASARFTGGAVLGAKDVQGVTRKVDLLIVDEVQVCGVTLVWL
jgi:hypothetical protein